MLDCQKLYSLMDEMGVKSMRQLATAARIPYTTLIYMRSGHDMEVSSLVGLANFFKVPADYLIDTTYGILTVTDTSSEFTKSTNLYEVTMLSMM